MTTTMTESHKAITLPNGTTLFSRSCLVLCWIACFLVTSPGDMSAQGICDRTPQVRDKLVEVTGVSDCADITTAHLASVVDLSIDEANISQLQAHDFHGLINLKLLSLKYNQLSTLPQGVFSGLSNLRYLLLRNNKLRILPPGVFRGLDSLEILDLDFNIFRTLPEGIFDDVLDTLRSISTGPSLNANLAFASSTQNGHEEETVRARVTLSQALPLAVRIPYSVSGTATSANYTNLTPNPGTGLLFRAGETSKEIIFTVLKSESGLGKTVVLTLAEESQIKLRRSDGAGEDAPYLDLRNGVFLGYRHGHHQHIPHTVTIVDLNVCNRTPQVRDALVEVTGVSDCSQATPSHLSQVERLDLSGMRINALHVEDFSGLDSLRVLWLHDNLLEALFPAGVFDDVLDTLEDLRVDPHVKGTLSFWSRAQETGEGYTVRVGAILSETIGFYQYIPFVVQVPYSVEGTAGTDDFTGLPPASRRKLVFMPGDTVGVIEFTIPRHGNNLGKTIVFRLGDISQVRLRRSDGTGPDAPHLKAETLMNVRADKAAHTVTVVEPVPADVCNRTPAVQEEILSNVRIQTNSQIYDCAEITTAHLTSVTSIWLAGANLTALQANDFSGLISLGQMNIYGNSLTELPDGIFSGLRNLQELSLDNNSLTTLPEGVFQGLGDLKSLDLSYNPLTTLPEGLLRGLDNLNRLDLSDNAVTELPEGLFQGLDNLETLDLNDNSLTTLPEGVFSELVNLDWLSLTRNSLTELPGGIFRDLNSLKILWLTSNNLLRLTPGVFHGLSSIEGLYLSKNSLTELPEDLFQGLDTLKSLTLYRNDLRSLPLGIFSGLNSLHWLTLHDNSLDELPKGIFDDVLDTLGNEYVLRGRSTHTGRLSVPGHLQATLAFASPGQRAMEGATVRVPVTLSRESPVTVRMPYTLGYSGAAGGARSLSPPPGRPAVSCRGDPPRNRLHPAAGGRDPGAEECRADPGQALGDRAAPLRRQGPRCPPPEEREPDPAYRRGSLPHRHG